MAKKKEAEVKADEVVLEEDREEMEAALLEEYRKLKAEREELLKEVDALKSKKTVAVNPKAPDDYDAAYWEELVPHIEPFLDDSDEAQSVKVNGRRFLIRRGEEVMIPRFVKHVLDNRDAQIQASRRHNRKLQKDFEDQTAKYFG